jgi:hypothetical protein
MMVDTLSVGGKVVWSKKAEEMMKTLQLIDPKFN